MVRSPSGEMCITALSLLASCVISTCRDVVTRDKKAPGLLQMDIWITGYWPRLILPLIRDIPLFTNRSLNCS
jgi:hypothetical protein